MSTPSATPGQPVFLVTPDGWPLPVLGVGRYGLSMAADEEFKVPVVILPGASGTLKYIPWGEPVAGATPAEDPCVAGVPFPCLVRKVFSTANGSTGVTSAAALHNLMGGESPVA